MDPDLLALSFIVARAPDVHHTAHLSTMAQGVGYLIASTGPLGLGVLHDVTGGWTVPMVALTVILVPVLIAGIGASRNRHVLEPARAGTGTCWKMRASDEIGLGHRSGWHLGRGGHGLLRVLPRAPR